MILDLLRLAIATVVVLLPGRLVARALGQRSAAATLAWAAASLFLSWAVVFTVHGTVRIGPTTPVCRTGVPCSKPAAHLLLSFGRGPWHVQTRADAQRLETRRMLIGTDQEFATYSIVVKAEVLL